MSFYSIPDHMPSEITLPSSPLPTRTALVNRIPAIQERDVPSTTKRPRMSLNSNNETAITDNNSDTGEILTSPLSDSKPSTLQEHCTRTNRDSTKYMLIREFMQTKRVSIVAFLSMYIHDDSISNGRHLPSARASRIKQIKDFLDLPETQDILEQARPSKKDRKQELLQHGSSILSKELDNLLKKHPFQPWSAEQSPVLDVPAGGLSIQSNAGTWYSLLDQLLPNPKPRGGKHAVPDPATERVQEKERRVLIFFLTLIVLRSRHARMTSYASTIIGLHFAATGASKRMLEMIGKIGLCPSYTTLQECIKDITDQGSKQLKEIGQKSQMYFAVDNLDIQDGVRDQRTGSTAIGHHTTTGLAIINPDAPEQRHTQDEFHRTEPLVLRRFLSMFFQTWKNIGPEVNNSFTWRALKDSLGKSTVSQLEIYKDTRAPYAFQRQVHPGRSIIHPLKGMYINSGTSDGAASVQLESLKQLGFSIDDTKDNILEKALIILVGDQKTIEMGRACRAEQIDSCSPVHSRNWLLLVPALFHVSMNLAQGVMVRTHWAPIDIYIDSNNTATKSKNKVHHPAIHTISMHTIQSDSMFLQYKDISAETLHFNKLDALLQISFDARITACLLWVLNRRKHLRTREPTSPEAVECLDRLSAEEFDSCAQEMYNMCFSPHAWDGKYRDPVTQREETATNSFTTLCRFMQQLRIYFTFRSAVRQGDIDKIENLLPMLAVIFFGCGKHKYGVEMLWLHWLLSPNTCTPELRKTIRGCLVVKQTDTTHNTGVDHAVELHNLAVKTDLKYNKNSTHTIETSIGIGALTAPYMKELRLGVERALGIKYNPGHTVKDVVPDTFALSISILQHSTMGIIPLNSNKEEIERKHFISENILEVGKQMITEKIEDFNQRYIDDNTRDVAGIPNRLTDLDDYNEEQIEFSTGFIVDDE